MEKTGSLADPLWEKYRNKGMKKIKYSSRSGNISWGKYAKHSRSLEIKMILESFCSSFLNGFFPWNFAILRKSFKLANYAFFFSIAH